MKWLLILFAFYHLTVNIFSQKINVYQSGILGQENLQAIANVSATSVGGMGFDNRYEGVRGSTRLFDTLMLSYMLVRGQDKYIQFNSDLDVVRNKLLFNHPTSGKLMELSTEIISELIINKEGKELLFKTTSGMQFDRELKEIKFCQILLETPRKFIKIPEKVFIEADYKAAYSADRRYDEYQSASRYFMEGNDGILYQIQLNKKNLIRIFPDKKQMINSSFKELNNEENEDKIVAILQKL